MKRYWCCELDYEAITLSFLFDSLVFSRDEKLAITHLEVGETISFGDPKDEMSYLEIKRLPDGEDAVDRPPWESELPVPACPECGRPF